MRVRSVAVMLCVWCLAGCASHEGATVYGAFHRVSSDDLRAISAEFARSSPTKEIAYFQVINGHEVRVHYKSSEGDGYRVATSHGEGTIKGGKMLPPHTVWWLDPTFVERGQKYCAIHGTPFVTRRMFEPAGLVLVHYREERCAHCDDRFPNHIEPRYTSRRSRSQSQPANVAYCPKCEAAFWHCVGDTPCGERPN
jgi:hypothetical protein